jgi:hypothetical protein
MSGDERLEYRGRLAEWAVLLHATHRAYADDLLHGISPVSPSWSEEDLEEWMDYVLGDGAHPS